MSRSRGPQQESEEEHIEIAVLCKQIIWGNISNSKILFAENETFLWTNDSLTEPP